MKGTYAGAEMRALRELAEMTQPSWAKLLRTTKMTISRIERNANRVSPQMLLLAQLAADPRQRAEWFKSVPKRK